MCRQSSPTRKFNHAAFAVVLLLAGLSSACGGTRADDGVYAIDVSGANRPVRSDHLLVGGASPDGDSIDSNDYYLTWNDEPIVPVTGEFHYARYPNQFWEESLRKMKAGGVNIVATYIHWIIHEEIEGEFDWTGDRDVRKFVELADKVGMKVIIRVGPFGHGEIRSGGFPDWLLAKPIVERSNDELYLHYSALFFNEIGKQLDGMFFRDGGPIIGVQLENEYQHSASAWAPSYPKQPYDFTAAHRDAGVTHLGVSVSKAENVNAVYGIEHMRTLKTLVEQAGMKAPLYTATGWGNATILPNETLPVTAAYAYPSWEKAGTQSPFFLYTNLQENPDYDRISYVGTDYPYFAAELGTGIMVQYTRRPYVVPESNDAMVNRFLGSGANGIGYYMYHGGTTPKGKRTDYLSEEAKGYPKLSYDFQAPLGEYGETRKSFHLLRPLHYFASAFGAELAPKAVVLPDGAAEMQPGDIERLRFAARADGKSAFVFLNNFQDHAVVRDIPNVKIEVTHDEGKVAIPRNGTMTVLAGESMILPVNMILGGLKLESATAQPMTRLRGDSVERFVFIAPRRAQPEFVFAAEGISAVSDLAGCSSESQSGVVIVRCEHDVLTSFVVEQEDGGKLEVLLVGRDASLDAWVLDVKGKDHLVISAAMPLAVDDETVRFVHKSHEEKVTIAPALTGKPTVVGPGAVRADGETGIEATVFSVVQAEYEPDYAASMVTPRKMAMSIRGEIPPGVNDLFIEIDYVADTIMAFMGNDLVADTFYYGQPWRIGLKRFFDNENWREPLFHFRALHKDAVFMDDLADEAVPSFEKRRKVIELNSATVSPEYVTTVELH